MSKYTTQIRWIVEQATANNPNLDIYQRIQQAIPVIFNFEFPIWAEAYRTTLETKILMHYFNKEIGFETVGLWKFYLNERLNLIMPYYNQRYSTTVKDYDYLQDVNWTETFSDNKKLDETNVLNANGNLSGTASSNTTADSSQTKTEKGLRSDTPQANYNNLDYATWLNDVNSNDTGSSTGAGSSESSQTSSQKNDNTINRTSSDSGNRTRTGLTGNRSFTDLVLQYRDSLLNIDMEIVDNLKDLFMTIY